MVDTSVNISVGCRSSGARVSVEYISRVPADMWRTVGSYRLSVDSRSMFGRYFADRSPDISRTLGRCGILSLFTNVVVNTLVDCRSPNQSICRSGVSRVVAECPSSIGRYVVNSQPLQAIGRWSVVTWSTVHRWIADTSSTLGRRLLCFIGVFIDLAAGTLIDCRHCIGRYM